MASYLQKADRKKNSPPSATRSEESTFKISTLAIGHTRGLCKDSNNFAPTGFCARLQRPGQL